MVKVTKHSGSPTATTGPSSVDATQGLTQQQSWEILCSVQGDMRKLSRMTAEMMDVSKKTLEELQGIGRGIKTLVEENSRLTDKMDRMVNEIDTVSNATEKLVDENKKATDSIQEAVHQNSLTALNIQEAIEKLVLVSEQNVEQMSGDAEVLIKAVATLSISQTEGLSFEDALKEAESRLSSDSTFAGQLKAWVKAVRKQEVEEQVVKVFEEKRKILNT